MGKVHLKELIFSLFYSVFLDFPLPSAQNWNSVTYGNGEFVAVVSGSAASATSP